MNYDKLNYLTVSYITEKFTLRIPGVIIGLPIIGNRISLKWLI